MRQGVRANGHNTEQFLFALRGVDCNANTERRASA